MLHFKRTFVYASSECWTTYCKGQQDMPPTYATWCIDHFKPKATGKQQMQAQAFSELPSSAKRQVLHKKLNCHNPSSGVSSAREDWLITRKETGSPHHTHTNFVTNCLPPITMFPKNYLFCPLLSFLSRCNLSLNSKSSFLSYSFYSWVFPMCTRGIHFSLVYLSFIKGASSQNSEAQRKNNFSPMSEWS